MIPSPPPKRRITDDITTPLYRPRPIKPPPQIFDDSVDPRINLQRQMSSPGVPVSPMIHGFMIGLFSSVITSLIVLLLIKVVGV